MTGLGDDLRLRMRSLRHPFDLAAVASLLVLVPHPRASLVASVALAVVAAVVVLTPEVRRSPWPWIAFLAYHGGLAVTRWYAIDNHDILIAYWALALAIAASRGQRDDSLATQARVVIGFVFGLAALWKVFSHTFLTGDFFRVTMLTDPRFARVAGFVPGVGAGDVTANMEAMDRARVSAEPAVVALAGFDEVVPLAVALTVGTLFLEVAVAVLMLLPDGLRAEVARSSALALFVVATYMLVPVPRFGIALLCMGIAQATRLPRVRWGFAIAVALLAVWANVWLSFVLVR